MDMTFDKNLDWSYEIVHIIAYYYLNIQDEYKLLILFS